MKTLMLRSAALSALILMAAETGSGSGSTGVPDGDLLNTDGVPHPKTADQVDPAAALTDPAPNPPGNAPGADPNPATTLGEAQTTDGDKAKAEKPKADKPKAEKPKAETIKAAAEAGAARDPLNKRAYMVWAQPGHETLGLGQVIAVPTAQADVLRGAGRARFASEAEVVAAKASDNPRAILQLDGV